MTLIVGKRSNLSKELFKHLEDSVLISSHDIEIDINMLSKYFRNNVNIIFNNFQASTLLNENINYENYIKKTILSTSIILTYLQNNNIKVNKIIYTSSSSVYGNNEYCKENDPINPTSLQASLKVANEELIKRYCKENNIKYTIVRLFNMYGSADVFSVISKIKNAYLSRDVLNIINNGNAIRDYIHIDDVVKVYMILINKSKNTPRILNVANGNGKKVIEIIDYLKSKGMRIKINNIIKEEINISIADVSKLNEFINTDNFIDVKNYLVNEIRNI